MWGVIFKGGSMENVVSLISTVGFPIVCAVAMGVYVLSLSKIYREDMEKSRTEIKELIEKVLNKMDNYTNSFITLTERIEKIMGGDKSENV